MAARWPTVARGVTPGQGWRPSWNANRAAKPTSMALAALGGNWDSWFGVMTIPRDGFVLAVASNIELNVPDELFRQLAPAFGHHIDTQ